MKDTTYFDVIAGNPVFDDINSSPIKGSDELFKLI